MILLHSGHVSHLYTSGCPAEVGSHLDSCSCSHCAHCDMCVSRCLSHCSHTRPHLSSNNDMSTHDTQCLPAAGLCLHKPQHHRPSGHTDKPLGPHSRIHAYACVVFVEASRGLSITTSFIYWLYSTTHLLKSSQNK